MAGVDVSSIVSAIEEIGFAVIDDCIPADDIAKAQKSVETAVRLNHHESVAVFSLNDFADTFLHDLEVAPDFKRLCKDIYQAAVGVPAPGSELVPSLRCLSGKSAKGHSMVFHYDTFVLTVILPIIIPTQGKTGRLVLVPNRRGVRSTYLQNLLDKLLLDNKFAQRRLHRLHAQNSARLRFIDMKPGNAYLFWGYRSVHTNEECDPDVIRSTAIFHYGDPHATSGIKKALGR
jgi:hypothetical protein